MESTQSTIARVIVHPVDGVPLTECTPRIFEGPSAVSDANHFLRTISLLYAPERGYCKVIVVTILTDGRAFEMRHEVTRYFDSTEDGVIEHIIRTLKWFLNNPTLWRLLLKSDEELCEKEKAVRESLPVFEILRAGEQ
jgi:hypothetical protein